MFHLIHSNQGKNNSTDYCQCKTYVLHKANGIIHHPTTGSNDLHIIVCSLFETEHFDAIIFIDSCFILTIFKGQCTKVSSDVEVIFRRTQSFSIEDDESSTDESAERKLLKRELRAQALKRLEDSARTVRDFENLVSWYDRLDANRQRKERYHELFRSGDDFPLDYGAVGDGLYFPDTLNDVLSKLERRGDFIDSIFYCPYDIHELVTDGDISNILRELSEDNKFLMFLWALRQYSSVRIAAIRGQSDRNIRKVRNTMLKRIRKKLLAALTDKAQAQQSLTLLEKEFLRENGVDIEKSDKK